MNVWAAGEELALEAEEGEGEHRFRTGRSHAGEGLPVPSGTLGESTGILHTACQPRPLKSVDSLRQNSSMISADLRPQRYRPLNRLNSPTHDRNPSIEEAMSGRKSAFRQFKITATKVRPA